MALQKQLDLLVTDIVFWERRHLHSLHLPLKSSLQGFLSPPVADLQNIFIHQ